VIFLKINRNLETRKPLLQFFTEKKGSMEIKDTFTAEIPGELEFLKSLYDLKSKAKTSVIEAIFMPGEMSDNSVTIARNETPVVIVHGTMETEESFTNYKEAALATGHPAELTTYMTVKDGKELQKSGQALTKNINNARRLIAEKHIEELKKIKKDQKAIKEYFHIGEDLYGKRDEKAKEIFHFIPGVIEKVDKLLKIDSKELEETFSGRTKEIEKELVKELKKAGFAGDRTNPDLICEKTAAEIMDTIAPRAVLVGHSMGGFVAYTQALNPKEALRDRNEFTYDGGNGVSTVITLSSPVAKGVSKPLPVGLRDYAYNLIEKNILDPVETFPGMQFSMINPFFNAWYSYNKGLLKDMYGYGMDMNASMMNPIIYAMKPGYEQISEGSDFIKKYVHSKEVPPGITAVAFYNPDDGISEPENSVLDESLPNAHNVEVTVPITEEDLKNPKHTKATEAHKKMSLYPYEHGETFKEKILRDPKYIVRILEPENYDGVRWQCMNTLMERLEKEPDLFEKPEFKPVLRKIKDLAEERLPFTDSPSYIAHKLIEKLGK